MTAVTGAHSLNPSVAIPPETADLIVDRGSEGLSVAEFIMAAEPRLLVLHGPPKSGKTELIKGWVVPALRRETNHPRREVLYSACNPFFPTFLEEINEQFEEAIQKERIIFIDNVERVLDLDREHQRSEIDRVFPRLRDPQSRAVVVLVTESRHLTSIYALASCDGSTPTPVCELPVMGVAEALKRLGSINPEAVVQYGPDVLRAVTDECTALATHGWADTFEMARLIHVYCRGALSGSATDRIGPDDFETMGGVKGILRTHLEHKLDMLDAELTGDGDTARAILEGLLDAERQHLPPRLSDIAARIGNTEAEIGRVFARMAESAGLLRLGPADAVRVLPQQLLVVIEEDLANRRRQIERAQRIVSDGLRSWRRLEIVLPKARFDEVHAERRYLSLDNDQTSFMLRCALQHESSTCPRAAEYWFLRSGSVDDGVNVLLSALFHKLEDVRLRAARLLGGYPRASVRERLYNVALADDKPEVRTEAVTSLGRMKTDELREQLLQEVGNSFGTYRVQAIEALRIFPLPEIADVLKLQVSDPLSPSEVRLASIDVLSKLNIVEAVDSLLEIAFDDPDEADRHGAARALASTESEDLNRRIFLRLAPKSRVWVPRLILGVLAVGGVPLFYVSMLRAPELIIVLWLAGWLGLLPMYLLMVRLSDERIRVRSSRGVIALSLFALEAVTVFPLFHGLAHLSIKMKRRATRIFLYELLGIVFASVAGYFVSYPGFRLLFYVFLVAGICLLVGSYVYDVVEALLRAAVAPKAIALQQRRKEIYEQIFSNPVAAKLVFDSLEDKGATGIPYARHLLSRFGRRVAPAQLVGLLENGAPAYDRLVARTLTNIKTDETVRRLESLWATGDVSLRKRIEAILYKNPNERSFEALQRLNSGLGRWAKGRATVARWAYPFSVLPRGLKLAAVVILLVSYAFLYTGFRTARNVTWPQLVSLRQYGTTEEQKVGTIGFLATVFPKQSGRELFSLFKDSRKSFPSSTHVALTKALARMNPGSVGIDSVEWRAELRDAVARYAGLLTPSNDKTRFSLGLDVLKAVAGSPDTAIADTASRTIATFIRNTQPGIDQDSMPRREAISALGSVGYQRALPLLDALISFQLGDKLSAGKRTANDLVDELKLVTFRRFGEVTLGPDSIRARERLLATVAPLKNVPKAIVDSLTLRVRFDSTSAEACRDSTDPACRENYASQPSLGGALSSIAEDPSSELAYRAYLGQYEKSGDYRAAAAGLERLARQYPKEVWPRKILSEVFHENLSLEDPIFFAKSYTEMQGLRKLKAFADLRRLHPTDYWRVESDYIEIAVSAGRYAETDTLARRVLSASTDPTERLNAALFAYAGYVLAQDRALAAERLDQLDATIRSLPTDFVNNWAYPGTERFISLSTLPDGAKSSLRKLLRSGQWYSQSESAIILDENRHALDLLRQN